MGGCSIVGIGEVLGQKKQDFGVRRMQVGKQARNQARWLGGELPCATLGRTHGGLGMHSDVCETQGWPLAKHRACSSCLDGRIDSFATCLVHGNKTKRNGIRLGDN